MTPEVPMLHRVAPFARIFAPMAPHALSAPPANTFVSGESPVLAAKAAVNVPASP